MTDGPGSASLQGMAVHMAYGGSRSLAQRYEYDEGSGAGFVELHPRHKLTGQELRRTTNATQGILDLVSQSSHHLTCDGRVFARGFVTLDT